MPKTASQPATVDLPFAVKGIHLGTPRHAVPEGYSPDMNNVLAYDVGGRQRMGTRPGLSKYFSYQFGGGAKSCQLLTQVTTEVSGTRTDWIITAFGGHVYRQKPSDGSAQQIDTGTAFSAGRRVECATLYGISYFTDGLRLKQYNHLTETWGDFTTTAGTMPQSATPRYCRLMCAWRGRLVQALLDDASPELWFMSKQGDPRDYDYGATPTAVMATAANNNYRAGQIGQPITALIPFSEDRLLFGLDHGIFEMRGDPQDGGTLMPISEQIGILQQDSWALVGGTLYFMGPEGFYKYDGMGQPENLSRAVYNEQFSGLPRKGYYVTVRYDTRRQGIWIFLTHNVTTYQTIHAFYDLRTGGLFPVSFPANTGGDDGAGGGGTGAPTIGPTKALFYDGGDTTTDDSVMLIGCRDGYIRRFDNTAFSDDGTAISSYWWSAPLDLAGATRRVRMNGWFFTGGEQASYNCDWLIQGADTAYDAVNAPYDSRSGTFTASGRQAPLAHRLQASTLVCKFSNTTSGKGFDMERITFRVDPAGRVR